MDRNRLLWAMTAEQFAAHEVQLYLDTHPGDAVACQMYGGYRAAHEKLKTEYEALYGPLSPGSSAGDVWQWIRNPWPWEGEAN